MLNYSILTSWNKDEIDSTKSTTSINLNKDGLKFCKQIKSNNLEHTKSYLIQENIFFDNKLQYKMIPILRIILEKWVCIRSLIRNIYFLKCPV